MELLIGLVVLSIPALLFIALPIVQWRRLNRATRAIEQLQRHVQVLDAQVVELRDRRGVDASVPGAAPAITTDAVESAAAGPTDSVPLQPVAMPEPIASPAHEIPKTPVAAPTSHRPAGSIEAQIGARWLLYFGVAAIVLGASYFLKYAFESAWITETGRVLIGGLIGGAIIYAGHRFIRAGFAFYGQILTGGGVAVLYLAAYAAFNYYQLIDRPVAFALMVAITALAAALADRERSEGLALFAVAGGFLTPSLVGGEEDAQIVLFSYNAVLVAGIVYLAHRRAWPWLNLVSLAFTIVTLSAWADKFYTPAKYLPTEIFLTIFCAMFVVIARANRQSQHPAAARIGVVLGLVPGLYHLTSLIVLFEHSLAFLVYLIAVSLVAMLVLGRGARPARRLLVWMAVALPFFGWLSDHTDATWRGPAAATLMAIYGMHLLAQLDAFSRDREAPGRAEVLLLHANGLGLFGAGYTLLETWYLAGGPFWAAGLGLWNGLIAAWLWTRNRSAALHFVALGSALVATAVGLQFDGAWITIGWAAEGTALVWLGIREKRGWLRAGAAALLAFAFLRVFDIHVSAVPAGYEVGFNTRVGSSLAVIGLLYFAAIISKRIAVKDEQARRLEIASFVIAANVLTLTMISSEIRAYWDIRNAGLGGELSREVMLSVSWAAYAVALIIEGIRRRYAPIRYLAIGVLGLTILKVFLVDLAQLDKVYRILSVVIVGMLLLLASYLYQRYSRSIAGDPDEAPQPESQA